GGGGWGPGGGGGRGQAGATQPVAAGHRFAVLRLHHDRGEKAVVGDDRAAALVGDDASRIRLLAGGDARTADRQEAGWCARRRAGPWVAAADEVHDLMGALRPVDRAARLLEPR